MSKLNLLIFVLFSTAFAFVVWIGVLIWYVESPDELAYVPDAKDFKDVEQIVIDGFAERSIFLKKGLSTNYSPALVCVDSNSIASLISIMSRVHTLSHDGYHANQHLSVNPKCGKFLKAWYLVPNDNSSKVRGTEYTIQYIYLVERYGRYDAGLSEKLESKKIVFGDHVVLRAMFLIEKRTGSDV